jgi:hypothetical protein
MKRNAVPTVTLQKPQAAAALDVSVDFFERHVQPELPVIRRGKLRLFRLRDLERWAEENAALTLESSR